MFHWPSHMSTTSSIHLIKSRRLFYKSVRSQVQMLSSISQVTYSNQQHITMLWHMSSLRSMLPQELSFLKDGRAPPAEEFSIVEANDIFIFLSGVIVEADLKFSMMDDLVIMDSLLVRVDLPRYFLFFFSESPRLFNPGFWVSVSSHLGIKLFTQRQQ